MGKTMALSSRYDAVGHGVILLGAFVSFVLSVTVWFTGNHEQGIFVGVCAILDGRYEAKRRGADVVHLASKQRGSRPAA